MLRFEEANVVPIRVTSKIAPEAIATREGTHPLTHRVKADPEPFQAIWDGIKTCEVRVNDRDYRVGDSVDLIEMIDRALPTGREQYLYVTHIQTGYGLPEGLVVISFKLCGRTYPLRSESDVHKALREANEARLRESWRKTNDQAQDA